MPEVFSKVSMQTQAKTRAKISQAYADEVAEIFLKEMLRGGTTSALVFCTVHRESTEALFSAAERRNMLVIAGKVCPHSGAQGPVKSSRFLPASIASVQCGLNAGKVNENFFPV